VEAFAAGPSSLRLEYRVEAEAPLRLLRFYFPNWRAEVDGREVATRAEGPDGLLALTLPAGRHTLTLRFTRSASEVVGWGLTLVGFGAAAVMVIGPWRGRRRLVGSATAGLVLVGVAVLALGSAPGEPGYTVAAAEESPAPVAWRLETGGAPELRLAWLGDGAGADRAVRVRVMDVAGEVIAEETARPRRGATQTDRWPANLLVEDRVPLRLPAGCGGSWRVELALAAPEGVGAEVTRWEVGRLDRPGGACPSPPRTPPGAPALALAAVGLGGARSGRLPTVTGGEELRVRLALAAWAPVFEDYAIVTELRDARSQPVAKTNSFGADDLALPAAWRLGEPFAYATRLDLPAGLAPGRYTLVAALFSRATGARPSLAWAGGAVEEARLADLRVRPAPAADAPPVLLGRAFGGVATLEGVAAPAVAAVGEVVAVRLWWRADGAPDRDYAAYVHLVGPTDALPLAQADGPAGGDYPMTLWEPGERVAEARALALPAGLAPGEYRLLVGLYDAATGERLPASGDGSVGTLHVTPG
jgi:hypothetical protein